MGYKPEDILPDDKSYVEKDGQTIRKGSVAAALANAKIVESETASKEDKQAALDNLKELAPTLINFELMDFLQLKNPQIQQIFDQAAAELSEQED